MGIRAGANTSPFGKEGLPALPHFFLPYCLGCNFHSQKLPCLFIDLVSFLSLSTTALSPVREPARLNFEVQQMVVARKEGRKGRGKERRKKDGKKKRQGIPGSPVVRTPGFHG